MFQRISTYIILGVVVFGSALAGVLIFNGAKDNRAALDKADQFVAAVQAAGYPAPDPNQVARLLGTDGGAVCADPVSALKRAALSTQLSNGAGGPGQRPILADSLVVRGERLVIQLYCPQYLTDFDRYVADLEFDDVIKEA